MERVALGGNKLGVSPIIEAGSGNGFRLLEGVFIVGSVA
jgi:hypothetical protein